MALRAVAGDLPLRSPAGAVVARLGMVAGVRNLVRERVRQHPRVAVVHRAFAGDVDRDRKRAETQAKELAERFVEGDASAPARTLRRLLNRYAQEVIPTKGDSK